MSPWIHGSNPLKVLQINELVKRFEVCDNSSSYMYFM